MCLQLWAYCGFCRYLIEKFKDCQWYRKEWAKVRESNASPIALREQCPDYDAKVNFFMPGECPNLHHGCLSWHVSKATWNPSVPERDWSNIYGGPEPVKRDWMRDDDVFMVYEGDLDEEEGSVQEDFSDEISFLDLSFLDEDEPSREVASLEEGASSDGGEFSEEETPSEEGEASHEETPSEEGEASHEETPSEEGEASNEETPSEEGEASHEEEFDEDGGVVVYEGHAVFVHLDPFLFKGLRVISITIVFG